MINYNEIWITLYVNRLCPGPVYPSQFSNLTNMAHNSRYHVSLRAHELFNRLLYTLYLPKYIEYV